MRLFPRLLIAIMFSGLLACGGGGGSGGAVGNVPAISRANPDLNFPSDTIQASNIAIIRAYPNLRFSFPLLVLRAPGDNTRLYVVQQGGLILSFDARDESVSTSSVFLDLSDRTRANGEQGLLGFAFHPDYPNTPTVYAYYSANANPDLTIGDSVIASFTADPANASADNSSTSELLRFTQPFRNHNGGHIAFGPDGMLYIASGDGGSGNDPQNNAQNLGNLLGKILRIAPDGSVPADNPFTGPTAPAGAQGEIWAYGLRNPFRFSFDVATERLWLGDVGQNAVEEINLIRRGGNYGWRLYEGTRSNVNPEARPLSDFDAPVFTYLQDDPDPQKSGRSITGGLVYRGSSVPALNARYVYGDFISGNIWALTESGGAATDNVRIGFVQNPSSFGVDLDGEILVTSFDGSLRRITAASDPGGSVDPFPQTLSDTGLFTHLADLTPARGVVEFEPAARFWSDGASKRRWIAIPESSEIQFSADGNWSFPQGSVTVKHFEMLLADGNTKRLETRVFLNQTSGWRGYTYRWRDDESDADLLLNGSTVLLESDDGNGGVRQQTYEFPGRGQCLECHTAASGFVLGLRTSQLNKALLYRNGIRANQLGALNEAAYFDRDIGAPENYPVLTDPENQAAPLALRARAYLETNCAQCHQPGGPTPINMDLRAATALAQTNTVNVDGTGTAVGGATLRIAPGSAQTSLIWTRMNAAEETVRMPPIATHVIDANGLALIGDWINAMENP